MVSTALTWESRRCPRSRVNAEMQNRLRIVSILALLMMASGCQVCRITDRWNDGVDRFANCEPQFDHWYRPHWDLNREYRPDGGDHGLFRRCRCDGRNCP